MVFLDHPLTTCRLATTAAAFGGNRPAQVTRSGRTVAPGTTLLWLAVVLAVGPPSVHAQDRSGEYQLKAAFVLSFIRFVDWPPELGALEKLEVCALGPEVVGDAFAALDGRRVRNRTIVFTHLATTEDTAACRVLFVEGAVGSQLTELLPNTSGTPVLTVGETTSFIPDGGIIAFTRDGNKIRFSVNLDASDRAGITIRSDLLRLASSVRQAGQNR